MLTPSYHSCSLFPLCQSFRGKLSLFFSKTEAVVSNRTKANPYVTLTEQLVEQLTTKREELAGPPRVAVYVVYELMDGDSKESQTFRLLLCKLVLHNKHFP